MRPKSNQCHCQALEKVSLGRAMLLVRYNWILRGVSFILFALGSPVLPKIDFFLLNFLFCKISWKFQFSVKWLHPKAKFKKGDPLKIQFYLTDTISQPNDTFSRAWQWHWFDFGLIFTFLLANWWFAARFSSCSSSLNFEAKINFYTTKENCRKCRAKCTGLKLDLGPFSGSQKRLLFNRISWWPCIFYLLPNSGQWGETMISGPGEIPCSENKIFHFLSLGCFKICFPIRTSWLDKNEMLKWYRINFEPFDCCFTTFFLDIMAT